jgi:hypothetical protein
VSSSWKYWLRLVALPSTVFAAIVFSLGLRSVSPFASWPIGLIMVLCLPSILPPIILLGELSPQTGGRRFRRGLSAPLLPTPRFSWRNVLTVRRATFVGALGALVLVCFLAAMKDHRGSPEMINGELVFTEHGEVIGPATEREADEARTRETRMFSGHLLLFGVVGQLARVPPTTIPPRNRRPSSRARELNGRPGGRRQKPASGESPHG